MLGFLEPLAGTFQLRVYDAYHAGQIGMNLVFPQPHDIPTDVLKLMPDANVTLPVPRQLPAPIRR